MDWKSEAVALLKRHEWRTGRCQECGGWQQAAIPDAGHLAHMVGHKKDCQLAKLLKEEE